MAATLEDAREIARLARAAECPWFSSSGLRFGDIARQLKAPNTRGVIVWGPGSKETPLFGFRSVCHPSN